MCVNGDDIEVWVYDGTDWITNRIPVVVDNLTTNSSVAALSARQGKLLGERELRVESLVLHTVISADTGTLTAYGDRKISDYKLLLFVLRAGSEGRIRDSKIIYPGALGTIMLYAHHGVSIENLSGMDITKTSDTSFSVTKTGAKALNGIEVIGIRFA